MAALQTLRAVRRDDIEDERALRLAHDINNPLTYVTANLELLARRLGNAAGNWVDWEEMRALVAESREGVDRIRRAVRAFQPLERGPVGAAAGKPLATTAGKPLATAGKPLAR